MNKLSLCGPWTMTGEDGRRFQASVPGTVLGTLLENGAIRDPYDGMNETAACAQTETTWCFEREFSVTAEQLGTARADLVFEGLDTLAEIELNGRRLARTDNMHRTWRIPVKDQLKPGINRLKVTFLPALAEIRRAAEENPEITYTGGSELLWTGAIRKAHYMFGWDWGPCLPDAGIWRPCQLEFYDSRIGDLRIRQEHGAGEVTVAVTAETGTERMEATLLDPEGSITAEGTAASGETLRLRIQEPKLWWPNGLGDQPLYTLKVRAVTGENTADERTLRLGLRTMTVSRRKDEWGESFSFCCNGTDFFAMGADYIPEDNLVTRMNRERTARLLRDCRDCHFNTIRVWGGGIYPSDDFYDLCDEYGLVVWQDLMFACNTYKMTEAFRENIRREAEDNLCRIRHHASLGLICGNNEMETAWIEWGNVREQPESLKKDYLEQFEVVLQKVCEEEAPDVFYWPSSPSSGGGFDQPNDLDRGDVHDWSVWHGRKPFSDFGERFPRFCSEFGFESFPCTDTLNTFVHDEREMNPFSRVMESHQKCRSGNATMLFYLSQTLRYPFSMEKLVHASQWLQAEAIRAGVEHWRRNRGRCMGAIYWQLNDCWPVASWSSMDSTGRWKALQYESARFFAPVAASLKKEEDGFGVFVTNETRREFRGTAVCICRDEKGRKCSEARTAVLCPPLSAVRIGAIRPPAGADCPIGQVLLEDESGVTVSEREALAVPPKYFPFERPDIRIRCEGKRISLTADVFCMGVEVQGRDARFSDNWFALYPGETRTVRADRELTQEEIRLHWIE